MNELIEEFKTDNPFNPIFGDIQFYRVGQGPLSPFAP